MHFLQKYGIITVTMNKHKPFKRCFGLFIMGIYLVFFGGFTLNDYDETTATHHSKDGYVILPHADAGYIKTTTSARVSILGACNPDYPLYMDGEPVEITPNGFFSIYCELILGRNVFMFTNDDFVNELVITRTTPTKVPPIKRVDFEKRLFGRTMSGNVSRFYDGNDNEKHGTPLATGTTFQIVAQHGDRYILHDGSYVYENRVELLGDDDEYNSYKHQLYSVDMDAKEREAIVTVYHANGAQSELRVTPHDSRPVTGYFATFDDDGVLQVVLNTAPARLQDAVVMIDAGHGGDDPGALGPPGEYGPMEKDFNKIVARRVTALLESYGVTVVYSGSGNTHEPRVLERIERFEETPVFDFVLSVHANSMAVTSDFTSGQGSLMFYTLDHSEEAAEILLRQVADATEQEYVTPIRRNFAMARYTAAPSMLFEMGYMCNPDEYERMLDEDYLDTIGTALGEGIIEYLVGNGAQDIPETSDTEPTTAANETTVTQADTAETTVSPSPERRWLIALPTAIALLSAAIIIRAFILIKKYK